MGLWMSLEIFDGAFSASTWSSSHGDALTEAAIYGGARNWEWHTHSWGVIFEVEFDDEEAWERFRDSPAVTAALDAVPDPMHGLLIYRGRGGSSSRPEPRRPRPLAGAGAAALPIPITEPLEDEIDSIFGDGRPRHLIPV